MHNMQNAANKNRNLRPAAAGKGQIPFTISVLELKQLPSLATPGVGA